MVLTGFAVETFGQQARPDNECRVHGIVYSFIGTYEYLVTRSLTCTTLEDTRVSSRIHTALTH